MGTNECDICGKQEMLPFKCKYCGGTFCSAHRIPEYHNCTFNFKERYNNSQIETNRKNPVPDSVKHMPFKRASDMPYNKSTYPKKRKGSLNKKAMSLLSNKLFLVFIVVSLLILIGSFDFGTNDGKLFNAYITPIINSILSSIDPYYNTDYYRYSLKETSSSSSSSSTYQAYQNGENCFITNYKNAHDPSYAELLSFISNDNTEDRTYIDNVYVCANFAIQLHDNAEAKNIKCYIITVDLSGSDGHMLTGFHTTDRGWIYVDDTGLTMDYKIQGCPSTDAYVNLIVGSDYIRNDIFPDSSGKWYHTSMGRILSYKIWDNVETYSIQNSLNYK